MSGFRSLLLYAALLGSLLGGVPTAFAQTPTASAAPSPEQRIALVIGNAHYQNAPQLENPDNDARAMAQLLNSAGFEVVAATDLTQSDMLQVVQDFSAKVAARGPNTVAMVYYAGHGVQLAGENYLLPVDAKISSPSDLVSRSLRLVDVMGTLEAIPSRMRIVVLDACRNNPFPDIDDAGRGLAIVDAPNGSIVGYSTAPGAEARDGDGQHSPYTQAFLKLAREPNVPIEQLFKRVRLEVNNTTDGAQIPWESSSLTSDFTFFGDTAVAATRAPVREPVVQMASNLPSRSVRQAYDYVLSEGSAENYREFVTLFPRDPLSDRIRRLLANLLLAQAWHKTVLANSPFAYKTFHDNYGTSPYALTALKLQSQPRLVPVFQPTRLIVPQQLAPTLKLTNLGQRRDDGMRPGLNGNPVGGPAVPGGQAVTFPVKQPLQPMPSQVPGKIVTLPAPGSKPMPINNGIGTGTKIAPLPIQNAGKVGAAPDVKIGRPNRFVDQAASRPMRTDVNTGIVGKPATVPMQVGRPKFNAMSGNMGMSSSPSPRVTQSMNQGGQGFGRRSFMR